MNAKKHIHIIGICGVATSALAIAFHKKGWVVSGSDKGFYPPVSTALEQAGIPFYAGWHPEKMISAELGGTLDFVVAGGSGTGSANPELMYARENSIPILAFAEALGKFFIKKNSIVTVGTWGKTTTSAILSFIMLHSEMKPSYFTGGLSLSHDTGEISDSDWSVVEGDEYQTAIWDKKPKFAYYSPTHLLLTCVSWDHADLYPTEKKYFDEFENLISKIPSNGLIVSCADDPGIAKVISAAKCKIVTYGKNEADYKYHSISHTKKGISFNIDRKTGGGKTETYSIVSPMLGSFNIENIAGCFAMALEIGIPANKAILAIADFKGIKRRLEKRFEGEVTLLDCHAPTAEKAQSVLESIREVYDKKIIAVFEPNIGGRQRESIAKYNDAFAKADLVVIPRLSKLKISNTESENEKPLEGIELADYISKTHKNVLYIENDEAVVEKICSEAKSGDAIAFLGSHGFRGMIEQSIIFLRRQFQ